MNLSNELIRLPTAVADRVDALFADIDRPGHPGASLAILSGGALIHLRCFGLANVEDGVPVTPQTVFRLGSVTKHLCAVAILILESRGLISLDDPAARYLPAIPSCAARVTILQLLTMTSGLPDGVAMSIFAGRGPMLMTRDQHVALASRLEELQFEPGAEMLYSNTNYTFLSLIVERLSGRSFAEFLTTELFEPLGMHSARVLERFNQTGPGKARGYLPTGTAGDFDLGVTLIAASGEGGVDMSMLDYVRWFQNYRQDLLIGRTFRARMEAVVRLSNGETSDYRLGLAVSRRGSWTRIGHTGGMPGFLADFCYYAEPDLGVLILTNWMDTRLLELSDPIVEMVAGSEPASSSIDERFLGFYLCPERGMSLQIQSDEFGPVCFMMGDRSRLIRSAPLDYVPAKCGVRYRIELAEPEQILVSFGAGPAARFRRWTEPIEVQPLAEFVGAYRSKALGEIHHVRIDDGVLKIALDSPLRTLSWGTMRSRVADVFTAAVDGEPTETNVTICFIRDAAGHVSGLRYTIFRCRGLFFERLAI